MPPFCSGRKRRFVAFGVGQHGVHDDQCHGQNEISVKDACERPGPGGQNKGDAGTVAHRLHSKTRYPLLHKSDPGRELVPNHWLYDDAEQ